MADKEDKKKAAEAEQEARQRYDQAIGQIREGSWRFSSKLRGQAGVIIEELIDPDGEVVPTLADVEGDQGALALAMPLDLITFETWLFGQIGDQDELDLEQSSHRETWFNLGSWIGEVMRLRHGGHWLIAGDEPQGWRLGFSKIMLELIPYQFAEQLLRLGAGAAKKLVSEIDRVRQMHLAQREADGGKELDRFTAQHYVRLHTVPLGQWMVMDLKLVSRLWSSAATRDLIKELKKAAKRIGPQNEEVVARVVAGLEKANQDEPMAKQTQDRALFEAISQILGLRRTAPPLAIDVLEKMVMPAMHIGAPERFPPLDEDDIALMRKGIELFALFVEVMPHKFQAEDGGFLGVIAHENLSTPYPDRSNLEVGQGDWVVVNSSPFKKMLLEFDSKRLMDKYDDFVKYLSSNPKAPRRRDDGRMLAETVVRALADLKACVVAASKADHALMFRLLPPPA